MSTYKIEGMTCEGCVNAITKALEATLPNTTIKVTLTTGEVTITGDHDPKAVKECILDAGFTCRGDLLPD